MTALDQAFIKAFTQPSKSPLAVSAPLADGQRTVVSGQWSVDSGQWTAGGGQWAVDSEQPGPEFRVASPKPLATGLSKSPTVPLSATLGGVWAALERPSKTIANLLKTENHVEDARQEVESEAWRVESGEHAVGLATPESLVARPLSLAPALSEAPPARPRELKPAWQVQHFTWPKLCRRLSERAAEELDRLADALLAVHAQGKKVLALGGNCRGEGATTLLLCVARCLAKRGIRPVLVDADLGQPRLAQRLGVQPQLGWDETTEKEGSLDQAILEATASNVALLPVREPPAECGRPAGDPSRLAGCLDVLRDHYDIVLVDAGPLEDASSADGILSRIARSIDAVVLVHNHRLTSEEKLVGLEEQLAATGIAVVGIVENFVTKD